MYMTGIRMAHIPYKGGALNVNALIGGETQVNFSTISTALPHVKVGPAARARGIDRKARRRRTRRADHRGSRRARVTTTRRG